MSGMKGRLVRFNVNVREIPSRSRIRTSIYSKDSLLDCLNLDAC